MALNMPTFYKRTGSAIVFAAVMLTGLLWDNPWAFLALTCLINALCLNEFFRLLRKLFPDAAQPMWLRGVYQAIGLFIILVFSVSDNSSLSTALWALFRALPLLSPVLLLAAALPKKNALQSVLSMSGGLFYITASMLLLNNMRAHDFLLPIALVVMIWVNDTMAYIVGSFIGKTQMSPISPKKTWEGTGGGALLTIICAVVYGYVSGTYTMVHWVFLSLLTAVAGTLGDLFESKLKRLADVKDSGNIMPGHGGALDRFDSLLVAAPVVFFYYSVFMLY